MVKANGRIKPLLKPQTNVQAREPNSEKRMILAGVVHAIILYGVPVWADIAEKKKFCQVLLRLQRKVLLRVVVAYRTEQKTEERKRWLEKWQANGRID
ncbi:hypothetical protein Zmor_007461 [Zophobas morio]|uniref:Reverse transcriptase domain-containing protein n=1 Tax=Zophobas morio TaxID=2755281 RepID=A0AA38IYA8_9CUCU|nr:hypothetical protein Zmor_007461 [Zophobas morio]